MRPGSVILGLEKLDTGAAKHFASLVSGSAKTITTIKYGSGYCGRGTYRLEWVIWDVSTWISELEPVSVQELAILVSRPDG